MVALDDDLRSRPIHARELERRDKAAVAWRRFGERHLRGLQRPQHIGQPLEFAVGDASAALPRVAQMTVGCVVAEQQRPNVGPAALRIGPADELLHRIDRFVRCVQTEGLQPGPDTIANLEVAFECLDRP